MLHSKKEKNKEICMILEAWQSLAYVIPASLCFLRVINSNFRKKKCQMPLTLGTGGKNETGKTATFLGSSRGENPPETEIVLGSRESPGACFELLRSSPSRMQRGPESESKYQIFVFHC